MTMPLVTGALRSGSMMSDDRTEVGAAGLKPPAKASGGTDVFTSLACTKLSPFASFHGYSANPAAPLGLLKPTVVASSWLAYIEKFARRRVLLASSSA